jgi:mannan endo-1,4-beta-mannosidase
MNTANQFSSAEAKNLLNYLYEIRGKGIVAGQHTQTVPMEEISYIKQVTGKEPKLRGFELLSYSPNINYSDASPECLAEVAENKNTAEVALDWAKKSGGIVTFSFHWFSPLGGRDKSFYAKNTDFDAEKIFAEDSPERRKFFSDMDKIAGVLKKFRDEKIPVLWRPFHESYGTWFWWGAKGPLVAKKLYEMMFERYTKFHRLDNLLWVWNSDVKESYPGDDKVDVVSIDVYLPQKKSTGYRAEYESLVKATSAEKVCALAEVGYLPDISVLEKTKIPWSYFMLWSKEFCIGEKYNSREELKKIYGSAYSITA